MPPFLVGTHLLLKGHRDDLSPETEDDQRPYGGTIQLAQFEAPPEDARGFHTKLRPPVVTPPPPKTRQELLDQADHDEKMARAMNRYGRELEFGGDAIDDMDIPLKEYGENRAGLPGGVVDAYGAVMTLLGINLQKEAKRRLERAQRARAQAARMPKWIRNSILNRCGGGQARIRCHFVPEASLH